MTGLENVRSNLIRVTLEDLTKKYGQYPVLSYAQRCVGRLETGTLTTADCEQINASNPDNYLRRLTNMMDAHVQQLQAVTPPLPPTPPITPVAAVLTGADK